MLFAGHLVSQMHIIAENALCKKKMYVSPFFFAPLHSFFGIIIFSIGLLRDGCPKIINLGSARTDLFYERKKYGFKKR